LLSRLALIAILLDTTLAQAWWSEDWAYRKKITLNTSATGADTREVLTDFPVLVRLHTGNFTFLDAKEDGSDLRFVAGDDKTPLKYHIDSWDSVNELALIWVRVPSLAGGSVGDAIWMYFGNPNATREDDAKGTYDTAQTLVLHFNAPDGSLTDASSYAIPIASSSATPLAQGPIDGAARFGGSSTVTIPPVAPLQINAQTGATFSAWVRVAGTQTAQIVSQQDGGNAFILGIDNGKPFARIGAARVLTETDLTPNAWQHVAATVGGGKLVLYVDGKPVAEASVSPVDMGGDLVVGAGLNGDLDEVQVSAAARSPDWVKASWAGQGPDAKLVSFGQDEQIGGGGHSYFNILLSAVTIDGWVVIVILMVMMVISFIVMVGKGMFVARTDRANQTFMELFETNPSGMLDPAHADRGARELRDSSLFRLWRVGLRELKHRFDHYEQSGQAKVLSPQALGAIKASLDAGMVRESARLNSQMVLLTIAISGGPFLGLLGTVVGVMITFAAIAAVGDVNVNSIAPGIAAALVATVAGLGVAIPALFGYNYLASRIKNLSNDMAVFADELITRMAEKYAP
jgi:biopolymer transport protein ExbB